MCREKEGEEEHFLRLRVARAGDQVLGCRLLSPPCRSRLLRLLRLLGTTGGWTNYSSCVQQMWNMLEVGGRGKYSTHSTSRAALPSQLGPKIAVGKHSHLVFGLVEEQS